MVTSIYGQSYSVREYKSKINVETQDHNLIQTSQVSAMQCKPQIELVKSCR